MYAKFPVFLRYFSWTNHNDAACPWQGQAKRIHSVWLVLSDCDSYLRFIVNVKDDKEGGGGEERIEVVTWYIRHEMCCLCTPCIAEDGTGKMLWHLKRAATTWSSWTVARLSTGRILQSGDSLVTISSVIDRPYTVPATVTFASLLRDKFLFSLIARWCQATVTYLPLTNEGMIALMKTSRSCSGRLHHSQDFFNCTRLLPFDRATAPSWLNVGLEPDLLVTGVRLFDLDSSFIYLFLITCTGLH